MLKRKTTVLEVKVLKSMTFWENKNVPMTVPDVACVIPLYVTDVSKLAPKTVFLLTTMKT